MSLNQMFLLSLLVLIKLPSYCPSCFLLFFFLILKLFLMLFLSCVLNSLNLLKPIFFLLSLYSNAFLLNAPW
jgi:hypothetical protein